MNAHFPLLKRTTQMGVVLSLLNLPVVAQEVHPVPIQGRPVPREVSPVPIVVPPPPPSRFSEQSTPAPVRFNLSFPGGTVVGFVDAVSKARGTPVNVVISPEDSQTMIPPLEMNQVDVPTLFAAVTQASSKEYQRLVRIGTSGTELRRGQEGFGFQPAQMTTSEAWVFRVSRPPPEVPELITAPEAVRFFNLGSLLANHTIDDITTVLSAGNDLRTNGKQRLNLKFHKETQLLIVRGTPEELAMVEEALRMLSQPPPPIDRPPPKKEAK